ncbi:T9SS type A sorting domain-containing protein [[Flexibacter] sp. ATCC 35103]|uniref:T9SS type A sorting domain-containing protein n=1 Tax=[Flexibacter] sp. ATCC 35103 TaxID=1937528 RepID=UPI000F4D65C2|nr:T9SS type A sorting domain-containing protein [[Flexibacter] sp. ATCC 35103]
MKKNDSSSVYTFKILKQNRLSILSFILILISFITNAQVITGGNPYCLSSSPTYTVSAPSGNISYTEVKWICSDPSVTFSGNPSVLSLSKVLYKNPGSIAGGTTLTVQFLDGSNVVAQSVFTFIAPDVPVQPSYYVTKTNDYCTTQYHIITLNVATNPNPSPNTNFTISARVPDASIIITQTSKNVFELKLPLNGQSYFLYDITSTTSSSGCLSNSVTSTSYGNSVSLNLTGCSNNTPGVNYDVTIAPNPYSNGYITIYAPAISSVGTGTICKVYNGSGVLKATFPLSAASTSFPLKATVGASLTAGLYIVQVTYPNGIVKTQNLVVN